MEGKDVKLVLVCLSALSRILAVGQTRLDKSGMNPFRIETERVGGLDKLENIQRMDNDEVYELAAQIVEDYFDADGEDEDENLRPALSKGEFSFKSVPEFGGSLFENESFSSDFGTAAW